MTRAVLLHPAKLLRQRSREVARFDAGLADDLGDLVDSLLAAHAAGLAGVQVGIARRIVAFSLDDGRVLTLVNPCIVWEGEERVVATEHCPSLPGRSYRVERAAQVKVMHMRQSGPEVLSVLDSPEMAVALQHELDHLNGVLPLDRELKETMRGAVDGSAVTP